MAAWVSVCLNPENLSAAFIAPLYPSVGLDGSTLSYRSWTESPAERAVSREHFAEQGQVDWLWENRHI